jgi:hypothetical protein
MTSITANQSMLAALKRVRERTEIRDSRGHIIGFFIPRELHRKENNTGVAIPLDLAEIQRRRRSKEKPIPHREVMRHMRLLDAEIERRKKAGEKKLTGDEAVEFVQHLRAKSKKKQNRS